MKKIYCAHGNIASESHAWTKTPVLCSLMLSYLKGHLFTVSKQCHNQPATILFEFLTWGDVNMFQIPFQALPEGLKSCN